MKIFVFLGSVYFALILIASVALVVILGTFLESYTESHRFAANFTYGNPVFIGFLWGFFVNILFSTLRRWPFKAKHIPFLITHLGLLMILGGSLSKSYFGLQGNMKITEGSGSHTVFLPGTQSILAVTKNSKQQYPLKRSLTGKFATSLSEDMELKEYAPHSREVFDTWIKKDKVHIAGLKPFPVNQKIKAQITQDQMWDILSLRDNDPKEAAKRIFLAQDEATPLLLFVQDDKKDIFLYAFTSGKEPFSEKFSHNSLDELVAYDQGYGGYAVQTAFENITLETPLQLHYEKETPPLKLEELRPKITLQLKNQKEIISLGYDESASRLLTPALQGTYLFRFQPQSIEIPYHIRLRQARAVTYPDSNQPLSYESDIVILDSKSKEMVEKTISMNNVYETWDGYRFYLANISPLDEGAVKRVQLIVNYDPAKYFLTYPGAILLTLGIILLFTNRQRHV